MEHLKYKTGDIFNCTGQSLLSKLIMWATSSDVSHTALFIDIWGEPYIIDSQNNGTNVRPFYEWKKKYNYKYSVYRNDVRGEKYYAVRAMSKSGLTGYDFELFVIRYPLSIIYSKIVGKEFLPKRKKNEDSKMICSEFVAYVHGLQNPETYTPKRLKEYIISNPNKYQLV